MNAPAHAIIFDWNCTLLDDFVPMHDCMNIIMGQAGRPPVTPDFFRMHYEVPFDRLYRNFGFGEEEIAKILDSSKGVFHDHYEPLAATVALRDGAVEILNHAHDRGLRPVILSNHLVAPIREQLRRLKIEAFFGEVLAYADRATQFRDMTKGEKLRLYMKDAAMQPAAAIIVGDSIEEIEIAQAQGLVSVAITGGCVSEMRLRAAAPDHLIHSLHELKPIMQERGFLP